MNKAEFIEIDFLKNLVKLYPGAIVICDQNTEKFCLPALNLDISFPVISIPPGESNKSAFSLNHIWNKLLTYHANRDSVLINIGGGVVTDIGGFAAATYNRGIKFINIPTSLMGMVDAANGGKTGINFNGFKNYIGTFSEPESIFIWTGFLNTLVYEHILSGFAEMLKHGLIADRLYFEQLSAIDLKPETLNHVDWLPLIKRSVEIKEIIVAIDFKETGQRKLLNFGHTIGHALESHFINENIPHGHFVAAGIICETWLSHKNGRLDESSMEWIINTIDNFFDRLELNPVQTDDIAELAAWDKKNTSQSIKCVYLEQIGRAVYDDTITLDDIKESLKYYSRHDWI